MLILIAFHKSRLIILRRILFIGASLYTMRTISMMSTQLPSGYADNYSRCRPIVDKPAFTILVQRTLQQFIQLGFQDSNQKMLCGDLLFSGHTLAMVLSSFTIAYYLPKSMQLLRYIPTFLTWIGMICMIVSRTHYTIDVLFAYWLTAGFFW
ncbi:unnamed protein product [Enterobius vermicularis]|uniref:PAP2_C domain-containing protein n=1 Tax=Enterobius vermicularis TaxID=51028 RepID=A0A0N4VM69_ENTVE|nr:unnamed protein product [Enterobius vermicularis]